MDYRQENQEKNFEKFGEPKTLDELAHFVIAVINSRGPKVLGFSWNLCWNDSVRNSHYSPICGVENFGRTDDLPKGYPGWSGRVWIRYASRPPKGFWASDPFRRTTTHTGTGGFGSYSGPWEGICLQQFRHNREVPYPEPDVYSWDYTVFADDWPKLKIWKERQLMLDALKGPNPNQTLHNFLWEDPETVLKDQAYFRQTSHIDLAKKEQILD